MKQYKCKTGFSIELWDNNGNYEDGNYMIVEENSLWSTPEEGYENYRFMGGEVRLEQIGFENESFNWLEITEEHLKDYFEEVK